MGRTMVFVFPWDQLTIHGSISLGFLTNSEAMARQMVPMALASKAPTCAASLLAVRPGTWNHQGGVRRFGLVGSSPERVRKKNTLQKLTENKKHDTICVYLLKRTYSSGGKRLQMLWPFDFRWDWKASKGLPWSKKYPTQPAKRTRMRRKRHPPFFTHRSQTFSVVGIPLFDQTMHRWTPQCCATLSLNLVMGGSFYREDGHQWAKTYGYDVIYAYFFTCNIKCICKNISSTF